MSPHRIEDPVLLRAALASLEDATIIHDESRVLYVNPAALRLLKMPSTTDILGRPVVDLVHPDARESMAQRLSYMMEHGANVGRFVEKLRAFDGEPVYAEIRAAVVAASDGSRAVIVTARPAK